MQHFCRLEGSVLHQAGGHLQLDGVQTALVSRVDGHRSIDEIVTDVGQRGAEAYIDRAEVISAGLPTFTELWQLDFLAMGIRDRP